MKQPIASFAIGAAALMASCGANPVANLVGSYSGLATITQESAGNSTTVNVNATVNIFEAPEGKISIVFSGKDNSPQPIQLSCRLTGTPTSTGFLIDAGSQCILEGTIGGCNGVAPLVTVVRASAVRSQLGLTVDARVQGTGCFESGNGPVFFNLSGNLTKNL
jgi:hypothetical protein